MITINAKCTDCGADIVLRLDNMCLTTEGIKPTFQVVSQHDCPNKNDEE